MRTGGYEVESLPTLAERFRMEQGMEIHRRAREIYPEGVFISGTGQEAVEHTKQLINSDNVLIYEGAFVVDDCVTKADILKKDRRNLHLIEVKSSANDKPEFIDDMAYTAMVIKRAGYRISKATLMLVSKDSRLGMNNKDLFAEIDHTDEVLVQADTIDAFWDKVRHITSLPRMPEPELVFECKQCPLFEQCLGKGVEHHIFNIPYLKQPKYEKLVEEALFCIADIPDDFPLTDNQAKVVKCVKLGEPFVGNGLKKELDDIAWPVYYLDFETVMTAIPLYPNIAPYTQIPTQYSIHIYSDVGVELAHKEYIADPARDCRRELAENLINDLGNSGSIMSYHTFEKNVINGLALIFPDIAMELYALVERIVDLRAIINRQYYHPDFHGSLSIKTVLPVLVPEMSYSELNIGDGDSASATFAFLAWGKYSEREAEQVKRDLLAYCKQDTLAMVKLHDCLAATAQ